MATNGTVHSNLPIPPGEYLEEVLAELGMTKDELARRMGRPPTKLSPIFKGRKAITPDTALQLEQVVGVPAHIWTGLEAEYRLTRARLEAEQREEQRKAETGLVRRYCYNKLVEAGEVTRHTRAVDKVRALQEFFGVMLLKAVPQIGLYQAAFRYGRSAQGERSLEAIAAWLRVGERRAQRRICAPFHEGRLRASMSDLRRMTHDQPERFQQQLTQLLAGCGVALVACPHFPKTKAHGATFWLGRNKAVLMISIRGKWADIFWFSLFHEIGHILRHARQTVILEDGGGDQREKEADSVAADALIPPDAYRRFVRRGRFYRENVEAFAKDVGIHPGIVVGRLQHEGRLRPQWLNGLRVRYEWVEA